TPLRLPVAGFPALPRRRRRIRAIPGPGRRTGFSDVLAPAGRADALRHPRISLSGRVDRPSGAARGRRGSRVEPGERLAALLDARRGPTVSGFPGGRVRPTPAGAPAAERLGRP